MARSTGTGVCASGSSRRISRGSRVGSSCSTISATGTKTARLESGDRPSDLFREQFFISAFPDDVGIGKVAEEVGVKNVVYSSDWPHKSMEAAKTQHCTLDDFRLRTDLDDDEKEAISGINAVEWFSL